MPAPCTVDCPSCRAVLQIPAGLAEPRLTCPRCLAAVANPASSALPARGETFDRDVWLDLEAAKGGLTVVGFLVLFWLTASVLATVGGAIPLPVMGAALAVYAALVLAGVFLARPTASPVARRIGRVLLNALLAPLITVWVFISSVVFMLTCGACRLPGL